MSDYGVFGDETDYILYESEVVLEKMAFPLMLARYQIGRFPEEVKFKS